MSIFHQVKPLAVAQARSLLTRWFPQGKLVGHKFLVGDYTGAAGDSADYDFTKEIFKDFASSEPAYDIIEWRARAFHGGDMMAAAQYIAKELGLSTDGERPELREETSKKPQPTKKPVEFQAIPPPEGSPAPKSELEKWDHVYAYRGYDGLIRRYIVRNDKTATADKKIRPLTYGTINGRREGWHMQAAPAPRIIYRLDMLEWQPEGSVVICEGEKAADAANILFPNNPCITWSGGSGAIKLSDWSPLEGRKVVIWPDNDKPGLECAEKLAALLSSIASHVTVIDVSDLGEGEDAADVQLDNPVKWLKAKIAAANGVEAPNARNTDSRIGIETIHIAGGKIHEWADAGEKALIETEQPLYQRSGVLLSPGFYEVKSGDTTILCAGLMDQGATSVVEKLSRAADWEKYDKRTKDWFGVVPPTAVAETILSRSGHWRFPSISGIITTPTLRPDGSVLAASGYDRRTQLFYQPDPSLRLDPDGLRVGRKAAQAALEVLTSLLDEFPLKGAVALAVALSGIITPVVRGMIPVAPMHCFRAAAPGSGKSYLVDVISAISAGRPCPVVGYSKNPEETEKRLVGLMLGSYPMIALDNVNGNLEGDQLCQAVERPFLRLRALGSSQQIDVENRSTFYATGNNIRPQGDLVRRVLIGVLDANMERPEERQFRFNPLKMVQEDRAKYVGACLTIVRSWRASGDKVDLPPLGSFEGWSDNVRSALVWLGCADPVDSQALAREEDGGLMEHRAFLTAVGAAMGFGKGCSWNARTVTEAALAHTAGEPTHPALRDLLFSIAGMRGEINNRKLGAWLGGAVDKIVGGHALRRGAEGMYGNSWFIE